MNWILSKFKKMERTTKINSSTSIVYLLAGIVICVAGACTKTETKVVVPPTITTLDVTQVTNSSASSGGNIANEGGGVITSRGVVWGTNSGPTTSLSTKNAINSGLSVFTSQLTSLAAATKYYVRAYAINSAGTGYGNELTFTTDPGKPTVTTVSASATIPRSATVKGTLNGDGGDPTTVRGVVWSTSSNPTIALPTKTLEGTGLGNFQSELTSLLPVTKYYVKAYATNSAGTSYGNEITFTTTPDPPTVLTTQVSDFSSVRGVAGGNITNDGGGAIFTRGVVWSTTPGATIALTSISNNGPGSGIFKSTLSGLTRSTKYYYRAYATNSVATSYGEEFNFTTKQYPTVFSKLYPGAECQAISQTSDRGYILAGAIISNGSWITYLLKTDSLGIEMWHVAKSTPGNSAHTVFQTADGGYLLANQASLQKFDANGNDVWANQSPRFTKTFTAAVETPDQGFIISGVDGLGGNQGFVSKMNSTGVQQWETYFSGASITSAEGITMSQDGNYVVTGGAGLPYSTTLAAAKIAPNGSIIWEKQYAYGDEFLPINNNVGMGQNNSLVICALHASGGGDAYTRIINISQDGSLQWQKVINPGRFKLIKPLSGGGYLLSGYSLYQEGGLAVKLDNAGTQIWNRSISLLNSADNHWRFYSAIETGLGTGVSLIFMGYQYNVYNQAQNSTWLLKTDTEGYY